MIHATPEAAAAELKDKGCKETMRDRIIHAGYEALGLFHFFTVGEDEVRGWTIRQGTKAPQAAGVIHTDFEKGFIGADVYSYADLMECGTEAAVKAAGKLQQKGRDYVVQD